MGGNKGADENGGYGGDHGRCEKLYFEKDVVGSRDVKESDLKLGYGPHFWITKEGAVRKLGWKES